VKNGGAMREQWSGKENSSEKWEKREKKDRDTEEDE
jgi:hypothetical protein